MIYLEINYAKWEKSSLEFKDKVTRQAQGQAKEGNIDWSSCWWAGGHFSSTFTVWSDAIANTKDTDMSVNHSWKDFKTFSLISGDNQLASWGASVD